MKGQLSLATRQGACAACSRVFWTPAVGRPRKWCPGCEEGHVKPIFMRYLLTSDGDVVDKATGLKLADRLNERGYRKIKLTMPSGKRRDFFVHRLVALFFLPKPLPGQDQVLHKNQHGDRADCRAEMLAWGTHAENVEDKRKAGTLKQGKRWSIDEKVIRAIRRSKRGSGYLAKKYGVSETHVRELRNGRSGR